MKPERRASKVRRPRDRKVIAKAKRSAAQLTIERQPQPSAVHLGLPLISTASTGHEPSKPHHPVSYGTRSDEAKLASAMTRLEQRHAAQIRQALSEVAANDLQKRWSHKAGTAETHEHIAIVPSRRRQSPLARMFELGKISVDELAAGTRIALVMEQISRDTSVRSASLEARVDCSGSARNALVESLGRIRAEVTYTTWRKAIPKPAAMILQMICSNQSYVAVARSYAVPYRVARKRLLSALRRWNEIEDVVRNKIDNDDVEAVYARLGSGVVVTPPPRPTLSAEEP